MSFLCALIKASSSDQELRLAMPDSISQQSAATHALTHDNLNAVGHIPPADSGLVSI